jgi:hypothetical protein
MLARMLLELHMREKKNLLPLAKTHSAASGPAPLTSVALRMSLNFRTAMVTLEKCNKMS